MLHFAYDGSIHGDWVAFYAIRLAAHMHDRMLRLLHVTDGVLSKEAVLQRIDAIDGFCRNACVQLSTELIEQREGVAHTLFAALPRGRNTFVLLGTRSRSRHGGYLAGTVAEKLLASGRYQALAVRVVQPGLLGWPRDVLVPVAGHPQGFRGGMPFLTLLAPDIRSLHLLFVQPVSRLALAHMTPQRSKSILSTGYSYLERIERELKREMPAALSIADAHATASDDVAREITNHARHIKARLIFVGASERTFGERTFRGNPLERILASAPCDVAVYRGCE